MIVKFEDWTTAELAEYLVDNEVYEVFEQAIKTDRCDLIDECYDVTDATQTESFIQKGYNGNWQLYVPYELDLGSVTILSVLRVAMEAWSTCSVSIEPGKYYGWEFAQDISPDLIKKAYTKLTGKTCKIIQEL